MSAVRKIEPLVTIYDLEALSDDGNIYELFEGELFVSKSPALSHQQVMTRLATTLGNYLDQNPIGQIWVTPGVIFDELNSAIPDLAFVRSERIPQIAAGIHIVGAPDLAIEILSPGSENSRRDNIVKRQTYGRFGVGEYWIVDPVVELIEISRLQSGVLATVGKFKGDDEITSPLFSDLSFHVREVFRR